MTAGVQDLFSAQGMLLHKLAIQIVVRTKCAPLRGWILSSLPHPRQKLEIRRGTEKSC